MVSVNWYWMYWYWYVLSISLTLVKYRYWIIVKKVTDYTRYLILDFRILNFMIRKLIQDMKKNLCSWMLAMKLFRLHCVKMMLLCNSGLICNGKYISKLVSIWNVFYWGQKNAKNVIDIVSNQNRCGITHHYCVYYYCGVQEETWRWCEMFHCGDLRSTR